MSNQDSNLDITSVYSYNSRRIVNTTTTGLSCWIWLLGRCWLFFYNSSSNNSVICNSNGTTISRQSVVIDELLPFVLQFFHHFSWGFCFKIHCHHEMHLVFDEIEPYNGYQCAEEWQPGPRHYHRCGREYESGEDDHEKQTESPPNSSHWASMATTSATSSFPTTFPSTPCWWTLSPKSSQKRGRRWLVMHEEEDEEEDIEEADRGDELLELLSFFRCIQVFPPFENID